MEIITNNINIVMDLLKLKEVLSLMSISLTIHFDIVEKHTKEN